MKNKTLKCQYYCEVIDGKMNQQRETLIKKFTNFWMRFLCCLTLITIIHSFSMRKQVDNTLVSSNSYKLQEQGKKQNRILTNASSPFQINYVIPAFLKNYSSRTAFCNYLCQPASISDFFSSQYCYLSYNCPSLVVQNVFFILAVILYGITPIFMIVFGIWTFKCWCHTIALMSGVVIINSISSKFIQQFQNDMQTDYDISTSQAISQKHSQPS